MLLPLACMGWSLQEIQRNERRAYSTLPGCETEPPDPYSDAFMESMPWPPPRPSVSELDAENEASGKLEPDELVQIWRRAVVSSPHACADLLLVSVFDGEIAAAACGNVSANTLNAYYEFKFVLAVALSDVVPVARRAANSVFLLDLGSRADAPIPPRTGQMDLDEKEKWTLPKLASSGGSASRLPVPVALPGFGSPTWQAVMREPVVGGGANWRWPDVKWGGKQANFLHANFSAGNGALPSREAFAHLAHSKALLELDAVGPQPLLAKLTLGSVVLSQRTNFPLWFQPLLTSETMLRVDADLKDLPSRLQWLAAHDDEARIMAEAGQRRACALLHLPNVAGYLGRLLQRYARIFDTPHTIKAHRAVRHLVIARRRKLNPFDAPERLWFMKLDGVGGRLDCSAWWVGEYSCHELRQAHRASKKASRGMGALRAGAGGLREARRLALQASGTAVAADSGARWLLQSSSGRHFNRVGLDILTHPHFFSLLELRRTRTGSYLLKDHSGGWLHLGSGAAGPRKLEVFVPPAASPPPSPPPMTKDERVEAKDRIPDAAEGKAVAEAVATAEKAATAAAIAAAQRFSIRKQASGTYTLQPVGEDGVYLQEDPTSSGHLIAATGSGAASMFRLKRVVAPNKYQSQPSNPRSAGREKTFTRRVKRSTVRLGGREFVVATYHNIGMLDWARLFWDWLSVSGIDRFMLLELDGLTCDAARALNCTLKLECATAYDMMLPREYTQIAHAGGMQSWGATANASLKAPCVLRPSLSAAVVPARRHRRRLSLLQVPEMEDALGRANPRTRCRRGDDRRRCPRSQS